MKQEKTLNSESTLIRRKKIVTLDELAMSLHCSKRTVSGALNVQKTRPRMVTTLHVGKFYACEAIGVCHRCDRIHHSEQLRKLVPPGANSGYDVLVYVGKALYLNHCSEEEVVRLVQNCVTGPNNSNRKLTRVRN